MMTLEKRYTTVAGKTIQYKVIGKGDPIILIHGLSASTLWWKRNITALSENFTVYLIDLPGYGTLRRYHSLFKLSEAEAWLVKWMNSLGISKAHLIGNSMGGFICTQMAIKYPTMVNKLVLVSPVGVPTGNKIWGALISLFKAIRYITPSFFPILLFDFLRIHPHFFYKSTIDILSQDNIRNLKLIQIPTLIIWGSHDMLLPVSHAEIFHKEIKNSRLEIIQKAGHVSMFDKPEIFNKLVINFLRNLEIKKLLNLFY